MAALRTLSYNSPRWFVLRDSSHKWTDRSRKLLLHTPTVEYPKMNTHQERRDSRDKVNVVGLGLARCHVWLWLVSRFCPVLLK